MVSSGWSLVPFFACYLHWFLYGWFYYDNEWVRIIWPIPQIIEKYESKNTIWTKTVQFSLCMNYIYRLIYIFNVSYNRLPRHCACKLSRVITHNDALWSSAYDWSVGWVCTANWQDNIGSKIGHGSIMPSYTSHLSYLPYKWETGGHAT